MRGETGWLDSQQKVESPTRGVSSDVRADAAIEARPAVPCLDALERLPYRATNPTLRLVSRYLEFDLDEIKRVHAEHGDDACAEPSERMVLGDVSGVWTVRGRERTRAWDGKKLGWIAGDGDIHGQGSALGRRQRDGQGMRSRSPRPG